MMKDYVEALEMCKKQAVQIVGLQNKQKELEAEKQETDEAYDDARQQIEFLQKENESLEKRLAIATKALKEIKEHTKELSLPSYTGMRCDKALKEMEAVND